MTPREELLGNRRLGPRGAQLLYRTVQLVAIGNGFPPPAGSAAWDETAVTEAAHDFVNDEQGPRRLLDIAIRSVDDRSFERLMETAVLNFLRDVARRTDLGKLILRVKEILRDEDDFVAIAGSPERWALADGPAEPSTVGPNVWASATVGVQVDKPRWTSERRDPPMADRASFVRLMRSILTVAAGSLTATDLAHALTARLDHRKAPLATELDIQEEISEPGSAGDTAGQAVAVLRAADIFATLGDRERILLPVLDTPVRDLAQLIGMGKTQTGHLRLRLIDRLRDELADDEHQESTVKILCELCTEWVERRTAADDATSEEDQRNPRGDNS